VNAKGGVVALPIGVPPLKYSTRLMVPSASDAVAFSVIEAGDMNDAPLTGADMATDGNAFTMTATPLEVVDTPRLS
jgi:hypothetical protein